MSEDVSTTLAKIGLFILKEIPSIAIEIVLSEQEALAIAEQRLNDLELIRSFKNIKQEADDALDEWILNLKLD